VAARGGDVGDLSFVGPSAEGGGVDSEKGGRVFEGEPGVGWGGGEGGSAHGLRSGKGGNSMQNYVFVQNCTKVR
jgi:hypothetical protein